MKCDNARNLQHPTDSGENFTELADSVKRCLVLIQSIVSCTRRKDFFSNENAMVALLDARVALQKELDALIALQLLVKSKPETPRYS